jgi:FAD binding domain
VIAIVQFAGAQGVQVTAQRTGHHAEPLAANDDVILVKTDALQGVEIDVERVARVRSGAKWGNVVPRASELGLAALHWSTPDVSVAGYSLGVGIGWYARKLGLSSNSVTAIELVTPDRGFRRVDHQHEPDLFSALRGGGGNFGIRHRARDSAVLDPGHLLRRPLLPVRALVGAAAWIRRTHDYLTFGVGIVMDEAGTGPTAPRWPVSRRRSSPTIPVAST